MIELNVKFLQENSEEKQETKKKAIFAWMFTEIEIKIISYEPTI